MGAGGGGGGAGPFAHPAVPLSYPHTAERASPQLGEATTVEYLWVGLGGFCGANLRYALARWIAARADTAFPLATFAINLTGSFAIGVVLTLLSERFVADPAWRLLLVVGFLGGYTTSSTYTFEGLALLQAGNWPTALGYMVASNVLGVGAVYAGMIAARALGR